jgi:hypothetical protein
MTTDDTPFEPKHLKRWTMPDNYFGAVWPATYSAGVGQSRDSDALERSNFSCMLQDLGGESDTVEVVRESHWLVGWVEWIAIHQDDEKALRVADANKARMEDYPALNEDHWSELEWTEAADFWDSLSPRGKVQEAMHVRERYHWLSKLPVWQFGRMSWCDLGNVEGDRYTIASALEERIRCG